MTVNGPMTLRRRTPLCSALGSGTWTSNRCSVCAAELCSGEAYQFDWSHEIVLLSGATVTVKVAHVRLCHSRMLFVREMVRYNRRFLQTCSHYLVDPVA